MNNEESLEERQENEVEAIKAIFGGAVVDVREQDVWKIRRPPEIRIQIFPPHSVNQNEAHVSITLAVKCDCNYPLTIPFVQLIDSKGLSDSLVKAFSIELQNRAQELKGQECMYALTELVQQFLYVHNTPATKSFYEQMLLNKEQETRKKEEEERKLKELTEQLKEIEDMTIEKQVEERRTLIQQEKTNRVHFKEFSETTEPELGENSDLESGNGTGHSGTSFRSRSKSTDKVSGDIGLPCKSLLRGTKELFIMEMKSGKKKKLMLIKSFAQGKGGCFLHYVLDVEHNYALLVLNEWIFRWTTVRRKISAQQSEQLEEESKKYLRQLDSIDVEFQSLYKLKNPGLVPYIGWTYGFIKDHVFCHVLKEFVQGIQLSSLLSERAPFSIEQIRLFARQILSTLSYLHTNNVPHRHIMPSSIFLDHTGKILTADYAIEKRLEEVYQYSQNESGDLNSGSKSGKKADILHFGNLIYAMSQGDFLKNEIVETPSSAPTEIRDFLRKCLQGLDKDRWSAEQLLQHPFVNLRNAVQNVSPTEKQKGFYTELRNHFPDDYGSDLASQLATRSLALPTESRLHREFEILEFCGRGGFGDVLKVRNMLDGRTYAIKRIPLNEAREKLNKRILREVQLLSRLNHENIVRYYNSWIESVAPTSNGKSDTSFTSSAGPSKSVKQPDGFVNSLGFGLADDIEKNAPPAVDGSIDWDNDANSARDAASGDLSPADEEGGFFGRSYPQKMEISTDTSDDVEFEESVQGKVDSSLVLSEEQKVDATTATTVASSTKSPLPNVVLFIQMEFCEKSTLRNCIDEGLYKDQERVWRLFREIVEGIGHIHQQGVIHRDLKPANIFIDSQEHVRLGDFGLATHTLMSRSTFAENMSELNEFQELAADETSRTGRVGTALYVAPELVEHSAKAAYSQKVDMYSLGICFFEMIYRPLPTGMERTKVLMGIRRNPPQFPDDFDVVGLQRQTMLVKWLCDHDPRKRPNAVELLQSDLLPPPKIEDAEMNEIVRHTVQNPQSKTYKHLISSLFSQRVDTITDLTYDLDVQKVFGSTRSILAFEFVEQKLIEVFHLHGAAFFGTPLLMPRPDNYTDIESVVSLMDTSGDIITIPHDLRIPFARYVARNSIAHMKRYCIERVYRKRKINAAHPRELYECAFDIVSTDPDSLMPDSECVAVVADIIKEFPFLSSRSFRLRLNHTDFLKAAFLNAGVPADKFDGAMSWLRKIRSENLGKLQAKQSFANLFEVDEHSYAFLEKFIETESTISNVAGLVRTIVKRKGMAGALAKKALQECENFIFLCEKMGCLFPVDICLGLTDKYMCDGVVFHIVYPSEQRGRSSRPEIFAAGGRFSVLVQEFRRGNAKEFSPVAAGVSIAFEKLLNAVLDSEEFGEKSAIDVLICALGSSPMVKEQIALVRELRAHGIRADILSETQPAIENIQIFCRNMGIHLVQLKDNSCTVRFVENDKDSRITERKLDATQLLDWLIPRIASARSEVADCAPAQNRSSGIMSQISESVSSSAQMRSSAKVLFFTSETAKLQARDKKRHTNRILTILEPMIATFVANVNIEVLAMDLPGHVLKWLPVHLSFLATGGRTEFHEWPQLCDRTNLLKQGHESLCSVFLMILFG